MVKSINFCNFVQDVEALNWNLEVLDVVCSVLLSCLCSIFGTVVQRHLLHLRIIWVLVAILIYSHYLFLVVPFSCLDFCFDLGWVDSSVFGLVPSPLLLCFLLGCGGFSFGFALLLCFSSFTLPICTYLKFKCFLMSEIRDYPPPCFYFLDLNGSNFC